MKNCGNCNNSVDDNARFCTKCGKAFTPVSQEETSNTEVTQEDPTQATGSQQQENKQETVRTQQQATGNQQQYNSQQTTGNQQQTNSSQQNGSQQQANNQQQQGSIYQFDHTHKFTHEDISGNKVFSMLCYLYGIIGIILAALVAQKSDFAMFHLRQACKFLAVEILCMAAAFLLFWTFIVPIACGVFYLVLFVIKIITVFQIAKGKAKEPAIIRSLGFLK